MSADVIWFDESAHMPQEEEPVRFREELLRFVASAGSSKKNQESVSRIRI
jgi:hypothetical protein